MFFFLQPSYDNIWHHTLRFGIILNRSDREVASLNKFFISFGRQKHISGKKIRGHLLLTVTAFIDKLIIFSYIPIYDMTYFMEQRKPKNICKGSSDCQYHLICPIVFLRNIPLHRCSPKIPYN